MTSQPPDAKGAKVSPGPGRPRYQEKHEHIRGRGLISSSALGLADGLITNIAFLTGFAEVADIGLVRLAGLAAVLAGTVSMFFGGVLAARSEFDLFRADSRREAYEIENEREEELMELKELYMAKGLTEQEADVVVSRVSAHKDRFLEDMLVNELHIHDSNLQSPFRLGAVVGISFLVGAAVPLIPYYFFVSKEDATVVSIVVSLIFLFSAGAWKGAVVRSGPLKSGTETLVIGAVAAAVLFIIGRFVGFL
ncbi:MAG: VIT1/CCC1 transporter family protein [Nitrososphaerota archaeon]|nr:VIT1/CCC1 transporter family protein [Nitrososphaerota archaeon]